MTLPSGFDLATDAAFRLVAGFAEPPKAGRVLAIEANGQARIEVDDGEGGEVLAWPLNGFEYAPGAVVYVLFAANAPESGLIVGSVAPAPTLHGGIVDSHGNLPGLGADDHGQYAHLPGRSGGQQLYGGTDAGDDLELESTTHATKGLVRILSELQVAASLGVGAGVPSNRVARFFNTSHSMLQIDTSSSSSVAAIELYNGAHQWSFRANTNAWFTVRDASAGVNVMNIEPGASASSLHVTGAGKVGVLTDTPLTALHVAMTGPGGGHAVETMTLNSPVAGTVLASGAVSDVLQLRAVIRPSSGAPTAVNQTLLAGAGPVTLYNVSGNTVTGEVTSGGLFRLQRTAGSADFAVAMDMLWI